MIEKDKDFACSFSVRAKALFDAGSLKMVFFVQAMQANGNEYSVKLTQYCCLFLFCPVMEI